MMLGSLVAKEHLGTTVEVQCRSLDDIFARNDVTRCDLLKLDCEGSEYDILGKCRRETLAKILGLLANSMKGQGSKAMVSNSATC